MDVFERCQVDGWPDFVFSLFAAVPVGFLLAALVGLAGLGAFGLLRLLGRLVGRA